MRWSALHAFVYKSTSTGWQGITKKEKYQDRLIW